MIQLEYSLEILLIAVFTLFCVYLFAEKRYKAYLKALKKIVTLRYTEVSQEGDTKIMSDLQKTTNEVIVPFIKSKCRFLFLSNNSYEELRKNILSELTLSELSVVISTYYQKNLQGLSTMDGYRKFAVLIEFSGVHKNSAILLRTIVKGHLYLDLNNWKPKST